VQTQCPECGTKFLVSDDQLRVAYGKVRCSKCDNVFNALESLQKPPQTENKTKPDNQPDEIPNTVTDFMSEDDLEEFSELKAKIVDEKRPEQAGEKEQTTPKTESKLDDDLSEVLKELERLDSTPPKKDPEPQAQTPPAKTSSPDEKVKPATEKKNKPADDPLEMLIPKKPPRKKGGLLWSIGILLLLAIALAQLAWFKREQLMHYPEGRMLLQTACKYAGCTLPTVRAPDKIQVLSRSITIHPEITNALLIQLTIANKAKFSQPQPLLQISLFNNEEMLVAQRRFKPDEYLEKGTESGPLRPGKAIYVELAIEDPGNDVTGFKLDFF
jgi:predicted Zn finger-like uncharacterized protein